MKNYLNGRLAGVRFCDVARWAVELLPGVDSVAVRSIDSTVAAESLRQIMNAHQIDVRQANGNLLLSRNSLLDALSKRMFTGFDELWFFEATEPSKNLSALPRATSDSEDFSISVPPEIAEAVRDTECVFLAADGNGLNYLTSNSAIAEALKKSKRCQSRLL